MTTVNWLYPVNEGSNYWLEDGAGGQHPVTPGNLWASIETDTLQRDSWFLSTGYRSLRPGDLIWIYAAGHQFLCALGQVVSIEQDLAGDWHAVLVWDAAATSALKQNPITRSAFGQIPQSPCRANPATSRYLNGWLADRRLGHSAFADEPVSEDDARRKVLASIVRRQGQTYFRRTLLTNYGGRCCATGEKAEPVLEAAHITPYMGLHSNRPSNGLLLRADIHTLFDLYMISIDAHGRWAVSSTLDDTTYVALRGKRPRKPKSSPPNTALLAKHFAKFRTAAER
jgi:hypothetical protein